MPWSWSPETSSRTSEKAESETKMKFSKSFVTRVMIVLSVVGIMSFTADAQTSRNRKKSKKTIANLPLAAPTTEPQIISRAEDYPLDAPVISTNVENAIRVADEVEAPSAEKIIAELTERIKALESAKK